MKKIFLALALLIFIGRHTTFSQSAELRYSIIPQPVEFITAPKSFTISPKTYINSTDTHLLSSVELLKELVSKYTGVVPLKVAKGSENKVQFLLDEKIGNPEEYHLFISSKLITIRASGPRGAFYAIQTIRQLMASHLDKKDKTVWTIPCCAITDYPKFEYRGFHLDVSRHFFSKEYILKLIDLLGMYKINKLQLHLTDDQGWRVQIDQFPLLTEIGAWRTFNNLDTICMKKAQTNPDFEIDKRFIKVQDGKTFYGGFYTKQDLQEIIKYATANYIDLVPEIDMPGHMSAAISAYPFLSCTGSIGWGKEFSYPACPCKPEFMDFAFKIWDEIAELFPYNLVHIGSDEVEKDTWASSQICKDFLAQHKLDSIKEIQNYFVNEIQKHLESKGKTVIAWDDVIDGKVNGNLIMMYWRDWLKDSPKRCAQNGNRIVLTPWSPFYISGDHTDETLKELYDYDPVKSMLPEVLTKVIGIQSCVWTEEIPSEACFEHHVFPRLQALSETCWSKSKDWNSFKARLDLHYKIMDSLHLNYHKLEKKN